MEKFKEHEIYTCLHLIGVDFIIRTHITGMIRFNILLLCTIFQSLIVQTGLERFYCLYCMRFSKSNPSLLIPNCLIYSWEKLSIKLQCFLGIYASYQVVKQGKYSIQYRYCVYKMGC